MGQQLPTPHYTHSSVSSRSLSAYLGLTFASISLGLLAFLFAAVPMLAVRSLFGQRRFLLPHLAAVAMMLALGLAPSALMFLVLIILVEVFYQARSLRLGVALAGLIAIGSALGASVLALGGYFKMRGPSEWEELKQSTVALSQKLMELSPQLKMDPHMLWSQLPAIYTIALMVALVLAVVMESRLLEWLAEEGQPCPSVRSELNGFRLPDVTVWVAIAALLTGFLEMSQPILKIVGLNIFYILVFLYFLQGMAVVSTYFDQFKVSPLWRSIWYFLMIVQFLIVVSLLGFSDYWLDYRDKIIKKSAEFKKRV